MSEMTEINEVIRAVEQLFPTLRVWQRSQIRENDDGIYKLWLDECPESAVKIYVENGVCLISTELIETHLQKLRLKKNKLTAELKRRRTPDETALIICEHFIKIRS